LAQDRDASYPTIPIRNWWAIRDLLKASIPAAVTPGYLSTKLRMTPESAKTNILPSLFRCGIIDQDGKPTDRARKWRDDDFYAATCEEIRRGVYPQELLDAWSGPAIDREAVARWFGAETGFGTGAQGRMASVYALLCESDFNRSPARQRVSSNGLQSNPPPRPSRRTTQLPVTKLAQTGRLEEAHSGPVPRHPSPSVHIDVQVHIPPDASPEQIDHIFASMAKHLYARTGDGDAYRG
jgi:hypothetical protein